MPRVAAILVLLVLLPAGILAGCVDRGLAPASAGFTPDSERNSTAAASGQTVLRGYLAARDGTLLAYHAVLPGDGAGTYPTLLEYSGYSPGSVVDTGYTAQYVPKGYAIIGVNIRGTGCSGGTFDFFEPVQALDGYDAVEWIAKQSWSDGKVGMIGKSYPGITQLFVAAERPPHLVAAAPGHVYGDIYRDVAYPGGIFNDGFAGLWSFIAQPVPGYQAEGTALLGGDDVCARHLAERTVVNTRSNAFIQAQEHRFDDELIRERSPYYVADKIQVPLYLFQSWQDEQVGVRGVNIVERLTAPYFLTLSNGDHGMYRTPDSLARLERFFDHYLKGVDNGFEDEPRVTVWWDAGANGPRASAWNRTFDAWPVEDVEPLVLHPRAGGVLSSEPAGASEAPDVYAYPGAGTSNGAGYGYWPGNKPPTDQLATPAPLSVTYTSAPFAQDVVVLGPGNFTFWVDSTAVDTDFQVVLSELRPDGKGVYVQKGWLRASHRAVDAERTSLYRPFHTHVAEDLLTPGEAVEVQIEIFPVGHAFRAGSALRLTIEAPNLLPELWGFTPTPLPAVNRIYHDAEHPGRLTLPVLAGETADVGLPACGMLIRQVCH